MNPHGDGKPEPVDPEQVLRMLEMELAQQRAARKQAGSPYRGFRLASFIFLFAVILGALLAFYYVFFSGNLDDFRTHNNAPATPAPSVATRP
jgi:hypothetical protein